ncbi:unannotated protein [freshwater metagenome]|uniref:Unannotated protein n=1 Tax=freshwater metagenome TaxID=449393 RepID=A0A6J6UW97_9ZZZZ
MRLSPAGAAGRAASTDERRRDRVTRSWAVATVCGIALGLPVGVAAPAHAIDVSCLEVAPGDPRPTTETASEALRRTGVLAAQDRLERSGRGQAGAGTTVAVLSSGISGAADLPLGPGGTSVVGPGPVVDPTGTVVAGLVAGPARDDDLPVGVAPGVELVDVRVYDTATPTQEGQEAPDAAALADGLAHVRDRVPSVDIVVVPLQVPQDDRVADLVSDLVEAGVLVVAQGGDRPVDLVGEVDAEAGTGSLTALATPRPDEDAGPLVHPAALPGVVAVGPLPEDVTDPLRSSSLDVVAPARDAVSVSVEGGHCVVDVGSSAWSTALVAGVLAMLRSAYPEAEPGDLVARLVATADGRPDVPSPVTGAGQVQALAALTATAGELRAGGYAGDTDVPRPSTAAAAPEEPEDLLATTRGSAVWWGLLGGGALLLAVLARPLLARRR